MPHPCRDSHRQARSRRALVLIGCGWCGSAKARRYLGAIAGLCKEGSDSGDDRVTELALRVVAMQPRVIRRLRRGRS